MRLAHHIMPEDGRVAAIGTEQRREHADNGCLARAVRPKHAVDASGLNGEVHVIDGAVVAEVFDESMGLDGLNRYRHSIPNSLLVQIRDVPRRSRIQLYIVYE